MFLKNQNLKVNRSYWLLLSYFAQQAISIKLDLRIDFFSICKYLVSHIFPHLFMFGFEPAPFEGIDLFSCIMTALLIKGGWGVQPPYGVGLMASEMPAL